MYRFAASPCPETELLLRSLLVSRPQASSLLSGSEKYPKIHGILRLYDHPLGTVVYASVCGLPFSEEPCRNAVFGFHIHEGGSCEGKENDPFAATLSHYNPNGCSHPYHAGDLPPLFGCPGDCFKPVSDRPLSHGEGDRQDGAVIHRMPDDFESQPAGNAGEKIACGVILPG